MRPQHFFMAVSAITIVMVLISALSSELYAQERQPSIQEKAIKVFLDRFWGNEDYIKREVPFINYVRDMRQAQVYVLLTEQETGGGGEEHTITFVGQEEFTEVNDTLKFVSKQDDTEEIRRDRITRYLKMGLMQYVSKTPMADIITINYEEYIIEEEPLPVKDKWDLWVFRIDSRADIEEEESYKQTSLEGSVSASRTTDAWKINLEYSPDYSESINETVSGTFRTLSREHEFDGLVVKSLNNHWSAGVINEISYDTRVNTHFSIAIGPAIEYNIFPYSMSTRKQCTFRLGIWTKHIKYREETIFDKMSEKLYYSTLTIGTQIIERWGDASTSLEGNMFFHDPEVNKLDWNANIDIRIFKGFSLDFGVRASLIHDQLYLAKGDRSIDEILLRRTQLKTSWSYSTWFGFNYTFGSQYSNIVNPRFGEVGRGGEYHR